MENLDMKASSGFCVGSADHNLLGDDQLVHLFLYTPGVVKLFYISDQFS